MEDKKQVIPKFKNYTLELKKKITDTENKEQIFYLEKKVNKALSIAKKYSKKEGLSNKEFTVTQIYIFLFYFRMIDTYEKSISKEQDDSNKAVRINLVNANKIYTDFHLSDKDKTQLNTALAEYSVPLAKHYSRAIKLGHDSVTSIFGNKKFINKLNSEIEEFEFYFPTAVDLFDRYSQILVYMQKARYYTHSAREKLLKRKIKNKNELIKQIHKQKSSASIVNNKRAMTMVKTSSRNQIDLLSIADKKAGIMITVNSILLTILIPLFASYIFDFSSFLIPIIILVVTCGLTILFATLATRPSSGIEKDEEEKLLTGERSIFYFKNFAQLPKDKFVNEAHELLNRDAAFEKAVFTDLYDVGVDLDRKYERLRWCYTIFASGIILTILSFLFSLIFL